MASSLFNPRALTTNMYCWSHKALVTIYASQSEWHLHYVLVLTEQIVDCYFLAGTQN